MAKHNFEIDSAWIKSQGYVEKEAYQALQELANTREAELLKTIDALRKEVRAKEILANAQLQDFNKNLAEWAVLKAEKEAREAGGG